MDMRKDFEERLAAEPESGLYRLSSKLSVDSLGEIAGDAGYTFYHIDGSIVTDHPSFYVALTHAFDWPQWGGGNWDAIFDVITEPRFYAPNGKGIIFFDQCHNLARTDPASFHIVVRMFKKQVPESFEHYLKHPSMKDRKPFQIYTLLRGEDDAFEALPEEDLPIPTFLKS